MRESDWLLNTGRNLHEEIRAAVVAVCEQSSAEEMSRVVGDGQGDTIYAVDRISEAIPRRSI